MIVKAGSTDVTTYFVLRTAADGVALTGATITNIDLQYVRAGAAPSAKVDATALAATNSAHGDNKAIEVDGTDQPGLYRVDWPDAAFAAGVGEVILSAKYATALTEHLRVELSPAVDAVAISGDTTAADNLELDYDGTGYAKANSTIGTTTTNTDMVGTDSAALASVCTEARLAELDAGNLPTDIADIPTTAEFEARTIVAANYFDPAADAVANVTLVDTLTTYTGNTVQTGDTYALANGATGFVAIDTVVDSILADTEVIGALGAGLTAIPWNSAWDAEVQSEVSDALIAINLDHLMKTATAGADMTDEVTDNTVLSRMLSNGDTSAFVPSTDGLQPIRDRGDAAWVTGAGGDATEAKQDTMITHMTDLKGAGFAGATDSNEAIRNRGDAAWVTGGGRGDE